MCKGTLTLAVALAAQTTYAAAPARTMYTDTLAREQAVRAVLTENGALATILTDLRAIVGSYELIVKLYPASGYSDNALWQAGRLSLDAYERFGQPASGYSSGWPQGIRAADSSRMCPSSSRVSSLFR